MQDRLTGKVIIVAGAGGIGNELARRYAAEGASVVLGDLDANLAQSTVATIAEVGRTAIAAQLDGGDDTSLKAIVDLAVTTFGGLDGFHANYANFADGAGQTDALEIPLDIFDDMMRVNARGFLLATRHAVRAMIERGGGSMIYTSSAAVYIAETVRVAYAMSKESTHALMRHVAHTYGPKGIRANVIAPGVISHPRFDEVMPKELVAEFMQRNLLKTRLGRPIDIAAMGALLMSDEGSYITGQVLTVDGGNTMRP
jgi:NAD(P)-dependent dehydrogenase (short-subunit alcohol dehydrogenase family)